MVVPRQGKNYLIRGGPGMNVSIPSRGLYVQVIDSPNMREGTVTVSFTMAITVSIDVLEEVH